LEIESEIGNRSPEKLRQSGALFIPEGWANAAVIEASIAAGMVRSGLGSFRELALAAGVSERALRRLRRGELAGLRLEILERVGSVLGLDWRLWLGPIATPIPSEPIAIQPADNRANLRTQMEQLRQEYVRLETRLTGDADRVRLEVQRSALTLLEPWLKNWPKVIYAVETSRPDLPLAQVVGLLGPIDRLLESWDLSRIGAIGDVIAFDPTKHVAIAGSPNLNDLVIVQRPGYRQGNLLLARAEVTSATPSP
jgi:transcriptional regulator with XRE-family HTH domain